MKTLHLLTALMTFSAIATGCSEAPTAPEKVYIDRNHGSIVGGQAEAGFEAVGALTSNGEAFCTGTLVDTTTVVTAAHCLEGATAANTQFYIGANANQGNGQTLQLASVHPHPGYDGNELTNDIAVLKLASPASVTPIPAMTQAMAGWVGKDALFVGYGVSGANKDDAGIKRSVSIPVTEVMGTAFRYESASKNTCFGDSGGPALGMVGGSYVLLGVTSYGDNDCKEYGVNTRVDTYQDFIANPGSGAPASQQPDQTAPDQTAPDAGGDSSDSSDSSDEGDICAANGWYGDGICDADCAQPDTDCQDETGDLDDGFGDEGDLDEEGHVDEDGDDCDDPDAHEQDDFDWDDEGTSDEDGSWGDEAGGWDDEGGSWDDEGGSWDDEGTSDEDGSWDDEGDEGDFCAEQGWYGDGICDIDCPLADLDCDED